MMVVQVNLGKVSVFCRVSVACASKSSVAFVLSSKCCLCQ